MTKEAFPDRHADQDGLSQNQVFLNTVLYGFEARLSTSRIVQLTGLNLTAFNVRMHRSRYSVRELRQIYGPSIKPDRKMSRHSSGNHLTKFAEEEFKRTVVAAFKAQVPSERIAKIYELTMSELSDKLQRMQIDENEYRMQHGGALVVQEVPVPSLPEPVNLPVPTSKKKTHTALPVSSSEAQLAYIYAAAHGKKAMEALPLETVLGVLVKNGRFISVLWDEQNDPEGVFSVEHIKLTRAVGLQEDQMIVVKEYPDLHIPVAQLLVNATKPAVA